MSNGQAPPPRMMPGRGLRLVTVHRVPVYVSPISLLFMVIIGASFEPLTRERLAGISDSQAYGLVTIIAVLTMVSIVLHELGHALVAQSLHFEVDAITIYGFVGVTEFRPEPKSPLPSFVVSVSGPLVNLVIGGAALAGYYSLDRHSTVGVLVFAIAYVNVVLGIFNLLPGLPLDGGQAFASGVWKLTGNRDQATRIAAYAGFVVAAALAVVALQQGQNGGSGYLLGVAALLALGAAGGLKRSRVAEKLPGLRADEIARRAVTVDANLPLSEALRRAEAEGVTAVIVADSSGSPWAVMNGAAADAVPADRRPWTTINQVSRPIEDGMRIPESLSGQELMEALAKTPASEYVVNDAEGQPSGVLVMVDFVARIDPAAAARLAPRP